MHDKTLKAVAANLTIVALLFCAAPMSLLAGEGGARLEGLVIGAEGKPAPGATVYLFDDQGVTRAQAVSAEDGMYSLRDLPAGRYGMSVQTAEGVVAPVSSAPIRLAGGQLARRDLKLVEADAATVDQALTANYGFGSWFKGLTGAEKAGVIVGFVAVGALIYAAFDDDDTTEQPSSPVE